MVESRWNPWQYVNVPYVGDIKYVIYWQFFKNGVCLKYLISKNQKFEDLKKAGKHLAGEV